MGRRSKGQTNGEKHSTASGREETFSKEGSTGEKKKKRVKRRVEGLKRRAGHPRRNQRKSELTKPFPRKNSNDARVTRRGRV